MDDQQLNHLLHQAQTEADRFFFRWRPDRLVKLVGLRVSGVARPRRFPPRLTTAPVPYLAAACLLLAFWFTLAPAGWMESNQSMGLPVTEQAVDLGGLLHRVDFFRLRQPAKYKYKKDLLAVMWSSRSGGSWQPVYSSLLHGDGNPLPPATLAFPGTRYELLLIGSKDTEENFLNYRLLGYAGGRVISYRTQDYVPQGEIDIQQGFLVERRAPVQAISPLATGQNNRPETTNLLPYYIGDPADLLVPLTTFQLEMGQYLMLVGNDAGKRIEAKSNGALDPQGDKFYAARPGPASLTMILDGQLEMARTISVRVVPPGSIH